MTELARESITAMMQQEEKFYRLENSLYRTTIQRQFCSCQSSQRALELVNECANIVSDFFPGHDFHPSDDVLKSAFAKCPSAVSVQDFDGSVIQPPLKSSSNDIQCWSCRRPIHDNISVDLSPVVVATYHTSLQTWREQMFDWSCMVLDSYGISDRSSVVALSFALLDRYVVYEMRSGNSCEPITREDFQLFSMTTLYMAVKILEGHRLPIDSLVLMSRGFYKAQDIIATEQDIITALNWRLNPPTPIMYCRLMWEHVDAYTNCVTTKSVRSDLENYCSTLSEIAVADSTFLSLKSSFIGLASILLSLRLRRVPEDETSCLIRCLAEIIDVNDRDFLECYHHLDRAYGS